MQLSFYSSHDHSNLVLTFYIIADGSESSFILIDDSDENKTLTGTSSVDTTCNSPDLEGLDEKNESSPGAYSKNLS